MCRTLSITLVSLLLVTLAGCGGDQDTGGAAAAPTRTANGCEPVSAPAPKGEQRMEKPARRLPRDAGHVATVRTNCGDFDITLDVGSAPLTTSSFAHLVREDFYDGLTFHRVSPGFVIQGGDPLGDGSGGPGYTIREAPPKSLAYEAGVVAMAKRADEPAGASGSQFFVVTESTDLPPEYALLGRVTRGMDAVERIAASRTDASEKPRDPVVISDVSIAESGS